MIDEEFRTAVQEASKRDAIDAPPSTLDLTALMSRVRRTRSRRRAGFVAVGLVATIALAAGLVQWTDSDTTTTANPTTNASKPADPRPTTFSNLPPGVTQDDVARGQSLSDTVNSIMRETAGIEGSAGYANNLQTLVTTVYWKAPVPSTVLEAAKRSAKPGVTVTVIPSPWSLADAFAASDRLVAAAKKGIIPGPSSMTLSNDATSLRVGISPVDEAGNPQEPPTKAQLQAIAGMPVTVVAEGRAIAAALP